MDCKNMCDLRVWGRRATYLYTGYRLSVDLLPDEKLGIWGHALMEKTAVQFARAVASAYNITSLHLKNIWLISNYFTKIPSSFFECYNWSKEIFIAYPGKAAR